ncbi:alcohol dehydrogenase [Limtongia smithiae]|uniref:alcohol dehydrogenase n=1 Tax=Limtongia smithiae TaxID=1125753 RepID=UPI0034CFEA32
MKGIVFKGPFELALEELPVPVPEADAVVVKVSAAALCGSDMHVYRGVGKVARTGFVMGHEMTGFVYSVGSGITKFKVGDKIVCPFTISCGQCFYCQHGIGSRCVECKLFGSPFLEGCQSEYVKVPLADTTLALAPEGIPDSLLPLMADIFPTGYFAAQRFLKPMSPEQAAETVVAVVGCGPVAQCAIISAAHFNPKKIFVIDSIPERLEEAAALGATPLNFKTVDVGAAIRAVTDGRGADIVIEAVGAESALRSAFDISRPFGCISSIGVHNSAIPFSATEAYNKNMTIAFGRCPVRGVFAEALAVMEANKEKLEGFVDLMLPVEKFKEGYELFDQRKVRKVVFTF